MPNTCERWWRLHNNRAGAASSQRTHHSASSDVLGPDAAPSIIARRHDKDSNERAPLRLTPERPRIEIRSRLIARLVDLVILFGPAIAATVLIRFSAVGFAVL